MQPFRAAIRRRQTRMDAEDKGKVAQGPVSSVLSAPRVRGTFRSWLPPFTRSSPVSSNSELDFSCQLIRDLWPANAKYVLTFSLQNLYISIPTAPPYAHCEDLQACD
jgi:hypothetical protein